MAKGDIGISYSLDEKQMQSALESTLQKVEQNTDQMARRFKVMTERIERNFSDLSKNANTFGQQMGKGMADGFMSQILPIEAKLNELRAKLGASKSSESIAAAPQAIPTQAFNVNELDKALGLIKEMDKSFKSISTSSKQISQNLTSLDFAKNEKAQARVNLLLAQAEKLKERQRLTDEQTLRITERISQAQAKNRVSVGAATFSSAMGMPDTSIAQRTEKIKALDIATRNLQTTDANYNNQLKQLNQEKQRLVKANQEALTSGVNLEKQNNKLAQSFQNLGRRVAFYATLGAVTGIIRQLFEVRGQYELLEKSLGAIIGDYDKASQIFAKQQQMAVKSPFTVIDLVEANKQLAAYGFAVDELVPVTKRLADISAGVGVEMSRIIYNVGQIRAKGILDARDLRDFGNAGLNVLGVLSKMYSEIENRTVTTGEVFDRVSARMVSYGDVMKVINQYTDEGGMFFNMQAQQAETLKGQISNLRDALNNMFNDIGKAKDSQMKGLVSITRSLITNYKTLANILETLIITYGTLKVATIAFTLATNALTASSAASTKTTLRETVALVAHERATKGVAAAKILAAQAQGTLNKAVGAFAANPYAFAAAAIIGLTTALVKAYQNANKLNNELNKIGAEGLTKSDELSRNFERLANSALKASNGSEEQEKALNALKTTYGDILPAQTLTIKGLQDMEGNYKAVTQAIYDKIRAQTLENQMLAVQKEYGEDIEKSINSLNKFLAKLGLSKTEANRVVQEFTKQINEGLIKATDDVAVQAQKIADIVAQQTGKKLDVTTFERTIQTGRTASNVIVQLNDKFYNLIQNITELNKKQNELSESAKQANTSYGFFAEALKQTEAEISKLSGRSKTSLGLTTQFDADEKNIKDTVDKYNEMLVAEFKKYFGKGAKFQQTFKDGIKVEDILPFLTGTSFSKDSQAIVLSFTKFVEDINKKTDELLGSDRQRALKKRLQELTSQFKISMDDITSITTSAMKGGSESVSELSGMLKSLQDAISDYEKRPLLSLSFEQVDQLEKMKAQVEIIKALGVEEKKNSSTKNVALEQLKDQLKIIKDMQKAYQEFYKVSGSVEKSVDETKKRFGELWTKVGKMPQADFAKVAGMKPAELAAYLEIYYKGKNLSNVDFQKELLNLTGELKFEAALELEKDSVKTLQNDIDRAMRSYDFSIELEGMGAFAEQFKQAIGSAGLDFDIDFDMNLENLQKELQRIKKEAQQPLEPIREGETKQQFDERKKVWELSENERVKVAELAEKNIANITKKNLTDTFNNYTKLLDKYADFEYRKTEIMRAAEKERADIQKALQQKQITPEQAQKTTEAVTKKEKSDIATLSFEQFKGTDLYIKAFEDLARVGTSTLEELQKKLIEFSKNEDLEFPQFREIVRQLKTIRDELIERNPLETFVLSLGDWKTANEELKISTEELTQAENELLLAKTTLETADQGDIQGLIFAQKQYAEATEKVTNAKKKQRNAEDKVNQSVDNSIKSLKAANNQYNTVTSLLTQAFDAAKMLAEGLGITFDPETEAVIKGIGLGIAVVSAGLGIMSTALLVADLQGKSLMSTLWPLLVIGAVLGAVFAIIAVKKAQIEKAIKTQEQKVKDLEFQYKKLEDAVDKAMGSEEIALKKQLALLKQTQIEAYKTMIALEKTKKKSDTDQIRDWEEAIYDLSQEVQNSMREIVDSLMGTNIKDAATDLAKTWLDMYRAGENAFNGIKTKFKDMIHNMLVNAIMGKAIQAEVEKIWNYVETALEDNIISPDEWNVLDQLIGTSSEKIDEILKEIAERYGIKFGETAENGLSALQKGISGITEEQAGVLEAYWNVVREETIIIRNTVQQMLAQGQMSMGIMSQQLLVLRDSFQIQQSIYYVLKGWSNPSGTAMRTELIA